jgi:hypothetical protein
VNPPTNTTTQSVFARWVPEQGNMAGFPFMPGMIPPGFMPPGTVPPATTQVPAQTAPAQVVVPTPGSFADVPLTAWYSPYIANVTIAGIMQGMPDGTFSPATPINRALFVNSLYNMAGRPEVTPVTHFGDVNATSWYAPAVSWANGHGIVQGVGSTAFAPSDLITREQIAVMLVRYANFANITLPTDTPSATFADQGSISPWATDAVHIMQVAGILQGRGSSFDPQDTVTRAEAAALFTRIMALAE